ncbi:MAG TPA: conjugal transfer protein TrbF [Sphingomicrobium sp.]|jgi:type IV secretion system protein VirB5|nr:conjugal transfer protein TrbF [Sphingomicrobium sp.]
MRFRRAVQRYGRTPDPQTPYQRAAQVWDERLGSARVQAQSWRLMAFGGLGLSAALSGGLLWQSMQSRVVPYVVAVDHLGDARALAPAERDYQPTDPQIAWFLAKFIADVRSISLDPVLMRQNWLSAYDFATARGGRFLSAYARESNPFGDIGTRTVSVQVTSVVRASDRSFELKWNETEYERGTPSGTTHWTAIISIVQRPPASADTLRANPLGLYVDAIDWTREIEPAAPKAPVAAAPNPSSNLTSGYPADRASVLTGQPGISTRSIP